MFLELEIGLREWPGTKKDAGTAIRAQKLSPGRNLGKKKLTTPITGGSQVVHSPILGQKKVDSSDFW